MTDKPYGATLFSRALYSSWCHVPRYNILFDCGEGCATHLGNEISNITKIFLGHGHGDHTLGLPSFIGCRNTGRGTSKNPETRDHNKSLEIFYPAGENYAISDLIEFIKLRNGNWLRYDLKWTPLQVGEEVEIAKNTYVRPFEMLHQKAGLTLGYSIKENRTRLKPEFQGKDIPSLLKNGLNRSELSENFRANLFAYCLDAYDIPDGHDLWDCEHAVMDCTFLNAKDRTDITHATLEEVIGFANAVGIKNVHAAHISPRYDGHNFGPCLGSGDTKVHYINSKIPNQI